MLEAIVGMLKSIFFFAGTVLKKNGFPPQLTKAEEDALIARLAEGDAEARGKLIEHNLRLVAHIARKYVSPARSMDDLISIGTVGLIKAVDTFDAEKCRSVAGYASRCIENELLMYMRSEKKRRGEISLEDAIGSDRDGNEITLADVLAGDDAPLIDSVIDSSNARLLREAVARLLSEQERRVVILRYGLTDGRPLAQREVGKLLGISRSYVSRIEKRALIKLNAALSGML
ncbi:MAG: RNA polymerase sporulation sigma factor SigK [Clostridia bacterium]|nr:RNA polymerase sporulation sigma factor SigK [Clostridia bacterium]